MRTATTRHRAGDELIHEGAVAAGAAHLVIRLADYRALVMDSPALRERIAEFLN